MKNFIRIFLADDHRVVRDGLHALLKDEPNFVIAGEADSGLEVVDQVAQLRPDILILDILIPGLNGIEVCRQVSSRYPQTKVIMLSMYNSEAYVAESLRNGASGYVVKDASASSLVESIRKVMAGEQYISPPISREAVERALERTRNNGPDLYQTLTRREKEVFQLCAEGLANLEIADRLCISHRTVEIHRSNLMKKLGLKNRHELMKYAVRRGLINIDK